MQKEPGQELCYEEHLSEDIYSETKIIWERYGKSTRHCCLNVATLTPEGSCWEAERVTTELQGSPAAQAPTQLGKAQALL